MSDENTEVSESTSDGQEAQTSNTETQVNEKPAGYHPVDPATASPEEVQNRIDYLYRQVKDQGRNLSEYRTIAQQQSQQIDQLMNGVGQVVDHLQTKSIGEQEADINSRMQTAFESGDLKTYMAENKKLIQIEAQKIIAQQNKPQQRNQTQQMAFAGAQQIAKQAEQDGTLAPDDAKYVSAWQDETDDAGRPLRPWAKTQDPNDPDPDFVKMITVAKRVWEKNPHRSAQENLAEVDKLMGVQRRSGGQSVMGGSLTTRGKGAKIVLSPNQERIAVRTKFGANKGAKSDAEYISAYRKQIESVQSKGGR